MLGIDVTIIKTYNFDFVVCFQVLIRKYWKNNENINGRQAVRAQSEQGTVQSTPSSGDQGQHQL